MAARRRPPKRASRRRASAAAGALPSRRIVAFVTLVCAVAATLVGSCFRRPVAPPPSPGVATAPPPGPRRGDIGPAGVGTFNIEWLSLDGRNARADADLKEIAAVIKKTGCVVLGVEEVQDDAVMNALVRHLPGWKFQLGTSGRQQRCGILWDADRAAVGRASEWPDVNATVEKGGQGTLRAPLVAPVRVGNFDFTLVVVHLKAMFEPEDLRRRRTQVRLLRDRIEEYVAAKNDGDVIVVGDFNDFADSDALKELTDARRGKLRFVVTGARLPANVTSYLGRNGRIDHVVVTSPAITQQEWTGEVFVYPKPKGQERALYERSVSDHLPSWATFKTDTDHDP